ncbi:glutathione hydrolase 7-like [Mugil cephalus]|uniref:glutathione hydrolase 7-like n=1 Tax=Mugil cephalus TaxID=48193 RepID=UPI001FB772AE|nr:glutathione hydrolase 7-like [Mugil cephalus]
MDVSAQSKLNKQSRLSYKSFGISSQVDGDSSPKDFTTDFTKKHDLIHLKELPVASGILHLSDQDLSSLKELDEGGSNQGELKLLYAALVMLPVGVTFALVLQICLGESLVATQGGGVVVSDHERCTALGQRVLHERGSSVDAAIAGALCLGVLHPHVSGVGGGGVMLVHDILKNETRVINFLGTAPNALREEMLQNVSELKAGLKVCVPGMLMGLHRAHSIYGSLSWEDVVGRAADVAREGFRVSHSLSDAISKVKGEQLSQRFRDMFIPGGRALGPGSYVRMPGLAGVLEAGLNHFYHGNVSQEIEDEVQENGGILSREDIGNYRVEVEQPLESRHNEFIIQVSPPPSAGAVLIAVLDLLEALHLSESNITENQTHHRRAEATKADLSKVKDVTEKLSEMLSNSQTGRLRKKINYSNASPPEYFSTNHSLQTGLKIGQVVVMGLDNLIVSLASSLSSTFGSRIVTRSGIVLNSLVHDFSWTDNTKGQPQTYPRNIVKSRQGPPSLLMPTIISPARRNCGIYMALSSSGGQNLSSAVVQMLNSALYVHKKKKDSLSHNHPHLQTNRTLGDFTSTFLTAPPSAEFPEEDELFVYAKPHVYQRAKTDQAVLGIQRKKDAITTTQVLQMLHSLL